MDLHGHLEYYWKNLDPEAQYILAALPLRTQTVGTLVFDHLHQVGLLRDGEYSGDVVRDYVRRQTVPGLLQSGVFVMDTQRRIVAVQGELIHLTRTEFDALKLFLENPGRLISPEDLEAALWPDEIAPDLERSRGIVKRLRTALGTAGKHIINRRGQGYILLPN
jgi:DNA-binding response OmpR family regulator